MMNDEFLDAIILHLGEKACIEGDAEFKGEDFNFGQLARRINDKKYHKSMKDGMPLEEAIDTGLVSRSKGYKDYPQKRKKK